MCSHYKVFAVPVFKADTDAMSAPYTPKHPLKHLLSSAVSSEAVSQAPDARPFIVGSYKKSKLPPTLKFDGGWVKSAFKPKTHYSIVVAAFTKVCSAGNSNFDEANTVFIIQFRVRIAQKHYVPSVL